MMRHWNRLVCLGVLVFAGGCGRGPEFAEVEGKLTKGGTPLKNVRVEFWPEGDGPKSSGVTDEQGRYTLKSEDGRTTGAIVGPHRVVLKDLDFYGDMFMGRKAENMPTLNKSGEGTIRERSTARLDHGPEEVRRGGQKNVIDLDVQVNRVSIPHGPRAAAVHLMSRASFGVDGVGAGLEFGGTIKCSTRGRTARITRASTVARMAVNSRPRPAATPIAAVIQTPAAVVRPRM